MNKIWLAILAMAGITYLIRVLPLTLIRKEIKNQFLKSFLYYVPFVTLTVMTFPAMLYATNSFWAALIAMVAGIVAAYLTGNLFLVSVLCCAAVFIAERFL